MKCNRAIAFVSVVPLLQQRGLISIALPFQSGNSI